MHYLIGLNLFFAAANGLAYAHAGILGNLLVGLFNVLVAGLCIVKLNSHKE